MLNSLIFINYSLGIIGIYILRKHLLLLIICYEILIITLFNAFGLYGVLLDMQIGDFMALSLFIIGLVETVIGISLIVRYYRLNGVIAYDTINKLRNEFLFILKN